MCMCYLGGVKVGLGLKKCDIHTDVPFSRRWVIALVALLGKGIPYKHTFDTPMIKFSASRSMIMNKANTPNDSRRNGEGRM